MSQQKTKSANKKTKSNFRPFEVIQKAEEEAFEIGQKNMETAKRSGVKYNHSMSEYAGICSDNVRACVEAGNITSRTFTNLNREMAKNWKRLTSEITKLSREASRTRSMTSMLSLNNKVAQMVFDNYRHEAKKLSSMILNNRTKAMEPLKERAAINSKQINKLFAA